MLETEVTQEMWESITGRNPSEFKGADLPVECVSWNDCQEFIARLNDLGSAPAGTRFSLPTEAQWEYACRAGTTSPFFWGGSLSGDNANCDGKRPYGTDVKGEFLEKTAPVGSYAANPWGLCDMHGNVWEWCVDWFDYYPSNAVTDPCPIYGTTRLMRGGGWYNSAKDCRSANRFYYVAVYWNADVGFRLTLVPKNE